MRLINNLLNFDKEKINNTVKEKVNFICEEEK